MVITCALSEFFSAGADVKEFHAATPHQQAIRELVLIILHSFDPHSRYALSDVTAATVSEQSGCARFEVTLSPVEVANSDTYYHFVERMGSERWSGSRGGPVVSCLGKLVG